MFIAIAKYVTTKGRISQKYWGKKMSIAIIAASDTKKYSQYFPVGFAVSIFYNFSKNKEGFLEYNICLSA